ncbi:hypothetical protein L2E82_11073 [Cichorium intybus]|uniref:Uncharacterized protein n=1 Tax=Cichorium intybus TaxID=13427 RepID=A0ACB9GBU3_CICIN|nr:hypothetical protein L2E82_11073 [Cichorium intybus]
MPDVTKSSTKSQIDQSDPLYLHPSDHPGLILVSTPFDGNGFGAWKRYVSIALSARNKLSFIEGTDKPQPTDPRYGAWRRCNDMIISWMLNSLSRDIAESVLYSETAHEIWTELDDRYGQANGAKRYQLQKNLSEIVQGNSNIATYFTRMKKYWDELNTISVIPTCTCGAAKILAQFENDQRLIQFLMGLNDDYGNIRGSILMMKPLPSINQAYTILIQDEKQREESASIKMAGNVEVSTSTRTNPRNQPLSAANFAVKMPPTSKSNQEQPKVNQEKRNWLELPNDVMANILHRIGAFDILENAQKVCTSWHKICKDPAMWRVIYIDGSLFPYIGPNVKSWTRRLQKLCKNAIDRSQGQLVDITIVDIHIDGRLQYLGQYVGDRSSQLRRLEISLCFEMDGSWIEALKKFPLLEELILYQTEISKEAIEIVGCYCPMLKTLKINDSPCGSRDKRTDEEFLRIRDEIAIAIGKNLRELRHLELIGNDMSNTGLEVILDGCRHLESLDLRLCMYVDLEGDFGKKCLDKINCLKLPNASLEGCLYRTRFPDYDVVKTWVYFQ